MEGTKENPGINYRTMRELFRRGAGTSLAAVPLQLHLHAMPATFDAKIAALHTMHEKVGL